MGTGYDYYAWRIGVVGATGGDAYAFDNVTVIPELSSIALLGLAGMALYVMRRRR